MTTKKSPYEQWADGKLKEIGAQMELLQAKAQQADADTRIAIEHQLEMLQRQYEDVSAQLSKLAGTSREAFEELKAGSRKVLDDMLVTLKRTMSTFSG